MTKFFNSIKSLIQGLGRVFSHLFRKSVTLEYPEYSPFLSGYFRGKHLIENCVGCALCQKVCPSNAITIEKFDNQVINYIVDYSKCIFCGNCVFNCPTKCIKMSNIFDLATIEKSDLKIDLKEKNN